MFVKRIAVSCVIFLFISSGIFATEGTRRFGIFAGANIGGIGTARLRYAVTDARSVSQIFSSMGGIAPTDNIILVEPTMAEMNRQFDNIDRLIAEARRNGQRTELVFYYSGHADEDGLLLNRERFDYMDLRERINSVSADMRIIILDSCSSGVITRPKGGIHVQPFLFDGSTSAEGFAILTSGAADEVSQESDSIRGSYFTHSLVTGLRGAADMVGDGRVTLNELYSYAFTQTLAMTETSLFGTQHPHFDIQISGSGDVVLTDIREMSASLLFHEDLSGRISIRDRSDFLIAELSKTRGNPLMLGLEPGAYSILLQQGDNFYRADITLLEHRTATLRLGDFRNITATTGNRRRGAGSEQDDTGRESPFRSSIYTFFVNIVNENFRFPLIGFVNIASGNFSTLELGFVNWNTRNFAGPQVGFVNTIGGDFAGVQTGFINTVGSDTSGIQFGFINTSVGMLNGLQFGFVNTAVNNIQGLQFGFVNTSVKELKGLQFGFVNYVDSIESGIPIGIISIVRQGGYRAIEYSFSEFYPFTFGFKIGVERFYTTFYSAFNPFEENYKFAYGIGLGSIIPINSSFFINPELVYLTTLPKRLENGGEERWNWGVDSNILILYFGYNINKNLSVIIGPSLTWQQYDNKESVEPINPLFSILNREIVNERNSLSLGVRAGIRYRF